MKYIITGHRGLIGEFLKKRLDQLGNKSVLEVDQREGFNILDLESSELELKEPVDIMFHFAAHCKINESIAKPLLSHMNNTEGIFRVLEFCRKHNIPKIVVASTSRVLSKERNPYVASKIYVEELVKAYHDSYGIDYILVRPSTVYGPCFDETSRLMSNFIVNAFRGEDLLIYGNETKTLDFTYVDDFVEGVLLCVEKNGWNKEYNISGGEEAKVLDVARMILEFTKSSSQIKFLPAERAQPQQVKIDLSEILNLGYSPRIGLREGVKKMVEWYGKNPKAWKEYSDKGAKYYNGLK